MITSHKDFSQNIGFIYLLVWNYLIYKLVWVYKSYDRKELYPHFIGWHTKEASISEIGMLTYILKRNIVVQTSIYFLSRKNSSVDKTS